MPVSSRPLAHQPRNRDGKQACLLCVIEGSDFHVDAKAWNRPCPRHRPALSTVTTLDLPYGRCWMYRGIMKRSQDKVLNKEISGAKIVCSKLDDSTWIAVADRPLPLYQLPAVWRQLRLDGSHVFPANCKLVVGRIDARRLGVWDMNVFQLPTADVPVIRDPSHLLDITLDDIEMKSEKDDAPAFPSVYERVIEEDGKFFPDIPYDSCTPTTVTDCNMSSAPNSPPAPPPLSWLQSDSPPNEDDFAKLIATLVSTDPHDHDNDRSDL